MMPYARLALRSPEISVIAITTVAGNADIEQATQNALYTAELCVSTSCFVGADEEKPFTEGLLGSMT